MAIVRHCILAAFADAPGFDRKIFTGAHARKNKLYRCHLQRIQIANKTKDTGQMAPAAAKNNRP
jgi:hypothetical protein